MARSTPQRPASSGGATLHAAAFDDLTPSQLYGILRVRSAVFVVGQNCVYLDLDGRDAEPGAVHLWHELEGEVVSTIRLLHDGSDRIIGRVATLPHARGRGLSGELIREGIARTDGRTVNIGAQLYLEAWYAGFGFVRSGPDYLEDDIPHLPMRLPARTITS